MADGPRIAQKAGSSVFQSMKAETLSGRASREVINSILSGKFQPGSFLPTEEKLCEQFGVSRSVVREAMRAVISVGMARSRQGRGTEVLDRKSWNDFAPELLAARQESGSAGRILLELVELRASVETQAAEVAALRAGPDDIAALITLHEAVTAAATETETDDFIRCDIAFHAAILAATGNELVVRLFERLEPLLVIARQIGIDAQDQPAGMNKAVTEHKKVLTAVRTSSPRAARAAMFDHLKWSATRDLHHELDLPSR